MIMWVTFVILLMPAVFCLMCALYLVVLFVAALMGRRDKAYADGSIDNPRLCVAIPAHNEEKLLARTIESIKLCDYPEGLCEVVVIADNCTDLTAHVARRHGATVLERYDESHKGKGHALEFFIERYLSRRKDVDAVIVVDADSLVRNNLLITVARSVEGGVSSGQVRYTVENAHDGWRPAMQYISLALKNHVRALGRCALGCSAGLFGNGMFFSRELLVKEGWPGNSIVEDVEVAARLIMRGCRLEYVPETFVSALMPVSSAASQSQKTRWEFGQLGVAKTLAGPLLRAAFKQKSLDCVLWFIDLIVPPLMTMFVFALTLLLISAGSWFLFSKSLMLVPALVNATVVVLLGAYTVGGLYLAGAPRSVWRQLIMLPAYAAWKAKVYIDAIISGGPKEWLRTGRD